jgi:hypothetical protein
MNDISSFQPTSEGIPALRSSFAVRPDNRYWVNAVGTIESALWDQSLLGD